MSSLETLARRAASELHSEVKSIPIPSLDVDRIRVQQVRRTIRTSVLAVAAVVVVVGVPIWLGSFAPDEPVAATITVPGPVTTVPDVQEEGMLTVETSLGTWQWVRDDDGQPGSRPMGPRSPRSFGFDPSETWVELPDPPLPAIEELVWPQVQRELGVVPLVHGRVGGFPVSFGGVTITPAHLFGRIDWNQFYSNSDGWVEGRWRPLDGDCPWPEVCPTQTATLEILAVREEAVGGGVSYPVDGVLDVLVASIIPGDPGAVEFRDEDTDELVLRVEANDEVSAQHLLRAGQSCVGGMECGGSMSSWKLYVEGAGWVDPPWQEIDLQAWNGVQAGIRNGGFWIVGIEAAWPRMSSTLHAWGSSDGVNWEELAPPVPLDAFADGLQQIEVAGGDLVILTPNSGSADGPPTSPRILRLVSGEFTEVEVDLAGLGGNEISHLYSMSWGWMATTWTTNRWAGVCGVWVSADGTTWEKIVRPDGTDTGETVHVFRWRHNQDGSAVAENPVPTPAADVPAVVGGSHCSVADDNTIKLEFEHLITGTGPEDGTNPDFYNTSWLGGFVRDDGRDD